MHTGEHQVNDLRPNHGLLLRCVLSMGLSLVAVACSTPWGNAMGHESAEFKAEVPSEARQTEIRKLLSETFELAKAKTAIKKQQAVQKLMALADDSESSTDDVYVALQTALPFIKETGDFPSLLKAVERLDETFKLDSRAGRIKHVIDFVAACKSASAVEPALNEVVSIAGEAARDNEFRVATELLVTAERHAKRLTAKDAVKSLVEVRVAVREREHAFNAQAMALATLANDADDPEANFVVGQWLAVYESHWEQALQKLVKGSDAKWKAAAEVEPKSPTAFDAQLVAADAWWDIAQASTGMVRLAAQRRAFKWYERHETHLKSPLVKAHVAKRMEELSASLDAANWRSAVTSHSTLSVTRGTDATNSERQLPVGKWINLLELVQPTEHALVGKWQRNSEAVICESSPDARCLIPVVISGSYELNCEFTRRAGADAVVVAIPVGSSSCGVVLSAWGGICHGLQKVDERDVKDQVVAAGSVVRPGKLVNGQRYKLQIEVSQNADRATIAATLDGQRIIAWQGGISQLSCSPNFALPCPQAVGVGIFNSTGDIHKLELRLRRGGKAYHLDNDWRNPVAPIASAPPKEVAAQCLNWKRRKFFISDKPMNFADAQRLATELQGRLLTVSSTEEEAFLYEQGSGLTLWLSGWRRTENKDWRDERNRLLRFIPTWQPGKPRGEFHELHLGLKTATKNRGLSDVAAWEICHACIEWGEEYPEDE